MQDLTAEHQRVRSYLLSQGERATWLDLWPRVVDARLQLVEALRDLTDDQAAFRPAAGEWSVREVAQHLLEYSRSVGPVIEALARGRSPEHAPLLGVLSDPGGARIQELRAALIEDAVSLTARIARLPDPPPLAGTVPHDFFGPLHCKAWYIFQRVHDLDHVGQIAQVKAAPGYPA